MHNALRTALPADCIELRVSRLVVEELTRAGVWKRLDFPLLIPQNDGSSTLWIAIDRAREMVDLCRTEQQRDDLRQGLKKAFTHVISNVLGAVRDFECRGLVEDPGYDKALAGAHDAGQLFQIGDRVFHEDLQEHVLIVGEFRLRKTESRTGQFYDQKGDRIAYRYGYSIQTGKGKFFAAAGELSDADYKPRHLILVRAYGEAVVQVQ